LRAYAATVGEITDRRARKKAQTRQQIRSVAQRLFDEQGFDAVTIADVAAAADVAVQTVFNHFATKEELFFDGRTSWVDSPAEAVRSRHPSVPPLTALRTRLVDLVAEWIGAHRCPGRRRTVAALEASDALRAYERLLIHESEVKLRDALLEAWAQEGADSPADPEPAAVLIAAVWVGAAGALVLGERQRLTAGADPEVTAATARQLADRVLRQLELAANAVHGRVAADADTGWPQEVRAG
jgi:AcrR family transcriptional regulator